MMVTSEAEASALPLRQRLRRSILAGDVDDAISLLALQHPALVSVSEQQGQQGGGSEVVFHLSCQKYIELVRWAKHGRGLVGRLDEWVVGLGP